MIQILHVDDDPTILNLTARYLVRAGFAVKTANSFAKAMSQLENEILDLAVIDIMLPDGSGFQLIEHCQKQQIPVIMVTARGSMRDKANAYRQGADDYLVKPFDPQELEFRVKAILRRIKVEENGLREPALHDSTIELGKAEEDRLKLDPDQQKIWIGKQEIAVPRREFQLLFLLCQNANRTLTREQIVEKIWGIDFEGDLRVVDLYIDRLRKRLHAKNTPQRDWALRTVRGLGYRMEK